MLATLRLPVPDQSSSIGFRHESQAARRPAVRTIPPHRLRQTGPYPPPEPAALAASAMEDARRGRARGSGVTACSIRTTGPQPSRRRPIPVVPHRRPLRGRAPLVPSTKEIAMIGLTTIPFPGPCAAVRSENPAVYGAGVAPSPPSSPPSPHCPESPASSSPPTTTPRAAAPRPRSKPGRSSRASPSPSSPPSTATSTTTSPPSSPDRGRSSPPPRVRTGARQVP